MEEKETKDNNTKYINDSVLREMITTCVEQKNEIDINEEVEGTMLRVRNLNSALTGKNVNNKSESSMFIIIIITTT